MEDWISVEDDLPKIPKGKYGIPVIGCWYCCRDEPQVVSHLMYTTEGLFMEGAHGPEGYRRYQVETTHWMYFPDPPER